MTNVYEEMDRQDAGASQVAPVNRAPSSNIYAQMDEGTPFERALAQREEEVISHQAPAQERYMRQQQFARELVAKFPQLSGPSAMSEPAPLIDPYLMHREPPIADREKSPKAGLGSGAWAQFKMNLVSDEETKKKILAQTLFPHDPDAINRVGFDAEGMPVYVGDDGKLHKIASGTARFGAQLAADSPEMVMGTIGGLGGPGGAFLGAAGAHGIKRGVAGLVFDEPQTIGRNLTEMTTEGVLAGSGEALGRLGNVVGNRGRVVDFSPADMAKAEAVRQRVKATTGVDLDLAQASGDRRLIALRAYVARYPGPSANLVEAAEERARGQFHQATERVLDTIAAATPAEIAGQNGINAAQLAIDTTRRAAEARVEPLFRAAYEKVPAVMDPSVVRFFKHPEFRDAYRRGQTIARLEEKEAPKVTVRTTRYVKEPAVEPSLPPMSVKEVPTYSVREVPMPPPPRQKPPGVGLDQRRLTQDAPPIEPEKPPGTDLVPVEKPSTDLYVIDKEGNIVPRQRRFTREKLPAGYYRTREIVDEEVMKVPDLRALDYTKRGLDQMIESLKKDGRRQEARALAFQRKKFVAALDGLDVPEYKAARAAWAKELEDNINPLEKGAIGVLSRMKDAHAAKAAARMFSDPNLTPTMIAQAKQAIKKESPEDWDALTRSWIAYKFNQAQRVPMTSTEPNTAGRFHQMLFGTPTARANTLEMLDRQSADALGGVMEAAEALKRTPIAGSNTFRDLQTKEIFQGLTGSGYKVWRALSSPREALKTAAERRAVEQSTLAVAEGILDPTMRHKLRVVLRMKPSTQRNVLLFNLLGTQTGADYAKSRMSQGENSELVAGEPDAVGQ